MRKYESMMSSVSSFIILGIMSLVLSAGVHAAPPTGKTVQGKIKTSASANAAGASVNVDCNGTVIPTNTDSNGDFSVEFPSGCDEDDTVVVTATFNGESGGDTDTVGNGPIVNFNTIFLSAVAVPEFGAITGLVAAAGSAVTYFSLRKKFI